MPLSMPLAAKVLKGWCTFWIVNKDEMSGSVVGILWHGQWFTTAHSVDLIRALYKWVEGVHSSMDLPNLAFDKFLSRQDRSF